METLNKKYNKTGLNIMEALNAGIDVCGALEILEEAQSVHGCVDLAHITRDSGGFYELKENLRGIIGVTQDYMPPECYRDPTETGGIDLYALGMALYRLFNGNRAPFMPPWPQEIEDLSKDRNEAFQQRMNAAVLPLPQLAGFDIPELSEFTKIILKAGAFHKQDRWQNATE
ncbi:MAG: hypothetical protein LBT26_03770, partial [Clostridiales Family XIII bacterium]|nr:hypothetical protein [Clostridiales Family XIII bacterium]